MPVVTDNRHPTLRVDRKRLATHLRTALRHLGRLNAEVSVSLVTDEEIQSLNAEWRGVNAVTDVLSFALEEVDMPDVGVEMLGDIVVSLDTAARQVAIVHGANAHRPEIAQYRLDEEVLFLATHGLLHLCGHDHQEAAEADAMEALERKLMAGVTSLDLHAADRSTHGTGAGA